MTRVAFLALSLIAALVTGCFDGGSDSSSSSTENQSAAGVYITNSWFISEANELLQYPVTVLIASTGEARFLLFSSSTGSIMLSPQFAGTVNVAAEKLAASLVFYSDGNIQTFPVSLEGTVVPKDNIMGDYVWGQDFGQFVLNYSPLYDEPSVLSKLEGIWTFNQASSGGAVFTFTLTIDADGTIFGSNTDGCVYNGKMSIIDSRYNVYRMSLDSSLCGELDGVYEGLATFSESDYLGRTLIFGATSKEHSLSGMVQSPSQP